MQLRHNLYPGLLLAAGLFCAQFGVLLHSDRHDAGTTQDRVCSICVTANQLASACISELPELNLGAARNGTVLFDCYVCLVRHRVPTRQRGPPVNT